MTDLPMTELEATIFYSLIGLFVMIAYGYTRYMTFGIYDSIMPYITGICITLLFTAFFGSGINFLKWCYFIDGKIRK